MTALQGLWNILFCPQAYRPAIFRRTNPAPSEASSPNGLPVMYRFCKSIWYVFSLAGEFRFSAALPMVFFRIFRPCRGRAHRPSPTPDCGLTALSGVTKISPLRGERFGCNFQKCGAAPKSHAALRFLPLRNCVVSSVKKRELSEATRNGMQCCKFSRFSEKRPILGKNRAAAKAHFFWFVFFVKSKENEQT